MLRSALLLAAAAAITLTAAAGTADARPAHRFKVFDQESGKTVVDDGKLDGKACVFGKDTEFDKETGKIKVVPKLNCNFTEF